MRYTDWHRRFLSILIQYLFGFFYMNLFPISSYYMYVMDIFSGYIVARKYIWQFSLLMIMYECQSQIYAKEEFFFYEPTVWWWYTSHTFYLFKKLQLSNIILFITVHSHHGHGHQLWELGSTHLVLEFCRNPVGTPWKNDPEIGVDLNLYSFSQHKLHMSLYFKTTPSVRSLCY